MLELSAQIATLLSLLLFLAAFITAFQILKDYRIPNIRFAPYFKTLLFQVLFHSLLLVLLLFFPAFKTAFLVHSFSMLPLYGLLAFRFYHLRIIKDQQLEIRKLRLSFKKPNVFPADRKAKPKPRLVAKETYRWR